MCEGERAGGGAPVDELREGLSAGEVRRRLARLSRLEEVGQRGLAFYLAEMHERGLHQLSGHASAAQYAEDRLELPPRRARELISAGRKLRDLPRIDEAFRDGLIGWSKVLLLLRVVTPEHEAAWVARALGCTVRELVLETKLVREGSAPREPGQRKGLREVRFDVRASVDVLTYRKLELAKEKLSAERGAPVSEAECLAELAALFLQLEDDGTVPGRTFVPSSLYRIVLRPGGGAADAPLAVDTDVGSVPIDGGDEDPGLTRARSECVRCDAESVQGEDDDGKPIPLGERDRTTPRALRNRVLARDGYVCRCCGSRRQLMVHHIHYRSRGGVTRAWNLITLCGSCHALVHADLLVLNGRRASGVRFRGPDGKRLRTRGRLVDPAILAGLQAEGLALPAREAAASEQENAPAPEPRPAPRPQPAPEPQPVAQAFAGLVGQEHLLRRLGRTARARRTRGRSFPHTLLLGPPGTGKTTLARGIAACYGARLVEGLGPLVQDVPTLTRLVHGLSERDMLFLDEIHAVPRAVLESLYERLGEGRFTLLAATTEDGALPAALRSRFGLRESLDFYPREDLACLAQAHARKAGLALEEEAARRLAACARGTPRELLRLFECAADDATADARRRIDFAGVQRTLADLGYDADGLDPSEQRYLALLRRSPRPVALGRLARTLGTTARGLLENVEPFLFRRGLVEVTERGRMAANVRRRPHLREAW